MALPPLPVEAVVYEVRKTLPHGTHSASSCCWLYLPQGNLYVVQLHDPLGHSRPVQHNSLTCTVYIRQIGEY